MTALIRINQEGQFSEVTEGDAVASGDCPSVMPTSYDQITQLLDQPIVRLQVDGFADGRGFSVARQLRLLGFGG